MIGKSLKNYLYFIFLSLFGVMLYFASFYINSKYETLKKSEFDLFVSDNIKIVSEFIHSLQIERGLSAGYIVANQKEHLRKRLLKRFEITDRYYDYFKKHLLKDSLFNKQLSKEVGFLDRGYKKSIQEKFEAIKNTRLDILHSNISSYKVIKNYSDLNSDLLELNSLYLTTFHQSFDIVYRIHILEMLQESAGRERAYLFYSLLSNDRKNSIFEIKKYIDKQQDYKTKLSDTASKNRYLDIHKLFGSIQERAVEEFRERFLKKEVSKKDAMYWFEISTKRIDLYSKSITTVIAKFREDIIQQYQNTKKDMFFALILVAFFLFLYILLFYILIQLLKEEEKMLEELRISAHTFDSHEAVLITDANGKIIKVNNSFSQITGYSKKDVIGKNPNILKSGKHSKEFYKKMWSDLDKNGKWSGEVYNKKKSGLIYPSRLSITAIKDEKGELTHYIAQFIDISDLKDAQERAKYEASHDYLTHLPNRMSLIEKLEEELPRAKRHNFLDAFLFLDLDGFKKVNDSYGHKVGDQLLIEVTKRVKKSVRKEDYVARISGDEFAIILTEFDLDREKAALDIHHICDQIIKNVSKPYTIDGYDICVGVSIGIKIFPDGKKTIHEIINDADTAMYQAKGQGKGQYVFFNKEIESKMLKLALLEKEIEEALQKKEFVFYMQPKVRVDDLEIIGAEMLVRWNHPQKGVVPPSQFLDTLKGMGKLSILTIQALKEACEFIQKYPIKDSISINVSTKELLLVPFIEQAIKIVEESKCQNHIEFEILENDLIAEFDTVVAHIKRLKQKGIKFSIDDFGTGYSSISYMRKLPVDKLKIDRYFIQNLEDEANAKLVNMAIDVAKTFELEVVVEGIENKEQLAFIRESGALCFQGFLYSEPMKKEQFVKLLHRQNS
ncbi:diguanylate cyclase/phosphodiesterase (GGDEF & EAL domains) with PAS/PAC sensor(s) [hydrothermal vent metagenome]|uniref:Diguanylate cyclase/phosphodiesterase (GGDEF & EAL domains) with PAS/PAC sensor(S) n=1 Tax=hydrothermal vent metagenome TaxID=652676 RepID=A0A1W1BAQ1_9ZZZZ